MQSKSIIIILCMLMLSGCAGLKESFRVKEPYTTADRAFQAFAIGGQVADYTSTKDAMSRGCIEANPLYGEHPSDATLIAGKVASSLVFTWFGNNITNHTGRKVMYGVAGIMGAGVAMHNYNLGCSK